MPVLIGPTEGGASVRLGFSDSPPSGPSFRGLGIEWLFRGARHVSSNSGRFGSGIDHLAEQLDREVSLSRSPTPYRITESKNAVEPGIE